jgi:hypothetical protein
VPGSFHYAEERRQSEDETITVNRVIFTTFQDVDDLDMVGPNTMYLGTFDEIRFSFSQRRNYYKQANVFHYLGDAVYPAMATQIVDSRVGFDVQSRVVSNSLPVWLALNAYVHSALTPWIVPRQVFPVFPSFAVPDNEPPPYASIHIEPEDTESIGAAPFIDQLSGHTQITQDRVRVTFYGLRNASALDFLDAVNVFSMNTDLIGLMNSPTVRDEKRAQAEQGILAQKKTAEFLVSYYQTRVNDFAQQKILSAVPSLIVGP